MNKLTRRKFIDTLQLVLLWLCGAIAVGFLMPSSSPKVRLFTIKTAQLLMTILFLFLIYVLSRGIPNIHWAFLSTVYKPGLGSSGIREIIVGTLAMIGLTLLIAVPVGVGSAIYLVEYAPRASRFVKLVRITAETLQGIPSIIYGLFGALFFVGVCKMGLSLLSGACTLAIMVLPVIMRTTEEALLAVPDAYRQGGYGLGAGRVRTVFRCVLPSAMPGILGGVILALGRCVGEVAALIFTAGSIAAIPNFVAEGPAAVLDSARTLAVHMYALSSEGLYIHETYATAVVLLVIVVQILQELGMHFAKLSDKRIR